MLEHRLFVVGVRVAQCLKFYIITSNTRFLKLRSFVIRIWIIFSLLSQFLVFFYSLLINLYLRIFVYSYIDIEFQKNICIYFNIKLRDLNLKFIVKKPKYRLSCIECVKKNVKELKYKR